MDIFEIIKRVNNGSLHKTKGIYPLDFEGEITREQNQKQIKAEEYYSSILDHVGKHIIAGDKETINNYTHYSNMRLTKSGKNLLRWSQLTLKDIDNSCGKDSIKNWLLKPLTVEIFKYIAIALLAFIAGLTISSTKNNNHKSPENIQTEIQTKILEKKQHQEAVTNQK